ncbi:MAG: ABC transporter permease [Eubacteriaceae bacterium]|jgi:ABC-2 type transport system permease protein|nr:ABC transporter permease [Eubacteriaceae bacterium]
MNESERALTVPSQGLKDYFEKFYRYRHLLKELVSRDIKIKYRRSVLGIVWSVLNPLLMMLVITAVFSRFMRTENFAAFYLCGSLIYNFVSEGTNGAMNAILINASLIKKVYVPKYIFPLEKVLFALVNALFYLIAVAIVFIIAKVPLHWTIVLFPIPLAYTFLFALGLGLILSTINVFFRDMNHLYSVWLTAWMYLTPIIYPVDILPEEVHKLIQLNPLYHYVTYFRDVMMYGRVPGLVENLICLGIALIFLSIGLTVFKKYQDQFILRV